MKLNRFANFAWAVVAYNLAVILWGAYVRASGSGAGCGSHWPLCNGEVIPKAPQIQTLIELTHRLMSGLALTAIISLFIWAFRVFPKKHLVRKGAALSLFFILSEALIGAGLVLFELVAQNASVARAMFMSVHLVNTFLLLASLALTAWWASGGEQPRLKGQGSLLPLLSLALLGALILAVSGAITALGDTLFPVNSLSEGLRQDFSTTAHIFIRLRFLHPALAFIVGSLAIFIAVAASFLRPTNWVKRWTFVLAALVILQIVAGFLNVALLAPIWLQLTHLLLADLVWLALVLLTSAALAQTDAKEAAHENFSLNPAVKFTD
ncbi:MAG TPA: COX15/CtaA family protein [Pyrinomonadaceae bacterium]|nr:COX15/CtaA family protein [Pyrinomonadaceae bacterium]